MGLEQAGLEVRLLNDTKQKITRLVVKFRIRKNKQEGYFFLPRDYCHIKQLISPCCRVIIRSRFVVFFFGTITQGCFHLSGISFGYVLHHDVQITWQVSNDAELIQEFFVLYKPVAEKEIWNFKKTIKQEFTLLPLQPETAYMARIVGYSASQQVYASGIVPFRTKAGKKIEIFSNSFFSKSVFNFFRCQ